MDTFSHALMGAALCSKTGLAGGRTGPCNHQGRPVVLHWTLWAALLFGLLPDLCSLGWYLVWKYLQQGHLAWRTLPPYVFTLYNWTHSLVIIALVLLLIRGLAPKLLMPALAWPLHVITDMFSHGEGRFATPILWPLSNVRFHGINWWHHPWLSGFTWAMLLALWTLIIIYRLRRTRQDTDRSPKSERI